MLHIYLGTMEKAIYHPPVYFDNSYEDSWLVNPLGREMIEDVDRSHVISAHLIESPVLGPISPKALSGGVKTLLLLAFDESGASYHEFWREAVFLGNTEYAYHDSHDE